MIAGFLESGNQWLTKFLHHTQTFLALIEKGDFSKLEEFHKNRDSILKALGSYDRKINDHLTKLTSEERKTCLTDQIKHLLDKKGQLIGLILAVDEQIVFQINEEKQRLQKELNESNRRSNLSSRFKSGWIPESGDKLDNKL